MKSRKCYLVLDDSLAKDYYRPVMFNYSTFGRRPSGARQFTVACAACGLLTSKAYARTHEGKCKSCVTGQPRDISKHPLLCPDCREHLRTPYQRDHGYHCDVCTRNVEQTGGIYGW